MSVVDISKFNSVEDFPQRGTQAPSVVASDATWEQSKGTLPEGGPGRGLDTVAFEINVIKQQTAGVIARSIFEIGKRLCEAKAMIGHGNWEAWLRDNVEYSETNARNLMRAYREMGGEQIDLLTGEAPCDVFETLNLSQMVALFPLPAHERAAFVKENDVASKSVREVEALVAEAVAQERARADYLQEELGKTNVAWAKAQDSLEKAEAARESWEKIANTAKKEWEDAKIRHEDDVRKLREQADKLKKKIKALEDAPVQEKIVYREREDERAVEAPAPTDNATDGDAQARADALQAQLDEVQGKLKAAEDKAALMAQKADPRVQAVNFALRDVAEKVAAIGDAIDEIRGGTTGDGELADKLAASATKAIKAMLEGAGWYQ